MTDIWTQLREPFPDSEVKNRPGAAKWDHKASCEGARCRVTRDENMHHQFRYVDARAVAQRLDDVLMPSGWQFTCANVPGTDIVKGRLEIIVDPTVTLVREDHGYPNSDRDEEPLKAATSDALKRCAVLFGVGRHLYEDNAAPHTTQGRGTSSPRPAPAPRPAVLPPSAGSVPEEPDYLREAIGHDAPTAPRTAREAEEQSEGAFCPDHGVAWVLKPGGTSKAGRKYDAFWTCPAKVTPFCNRKPDPKWVAMHEVAA